MGSIRTMLTNISQILLVIMILPIFALMCGAFNSTSFVIGLLNLLGQVNLCNTIADILSQYTSGMTSNDIANITIWTFFKEFPIAIISGISVHFCTSAFDRMWNPIKARQKSFKPFPILPGFLGIFLSTLLIGIIDFTDSEFTAFFIEIGVIVIMILGIKLIISPRWESSVFSLKRFLLWLIEGLYAVILSVYVAGIMMVIQDRTPFNKFGFIALLASITILASLLVFFARLGVKADGK